MNRLRSILIFSFMLTFSGHALAQAGIQVPVGARAKSEQTTGNSADTSGLPLPAANPTTAQDYVLGAGDRIRLTVYGEEDLSGEYEIGSMGGVALPLIGNVQASTLNVADFERAVQLRLAEGYLKDPRVSVQVVNYRPFFILGEVSKPGSYPYVNGMTVLNAVALAGGFSYRADKTDIVVVRASDAEKKEQDIDQNGAVMPGDVIRVPERFF